MITDLVLVHGFWSSPATWDRLVARIRRDPELNKLNVHPFSYSSPKFWLPGLPSRIPDYDDIAQILPMFLESRLSDTANVAVVTHSQGGLILQRFLAWMLSEGRGYDLARIRLIAMLACPNEGAEYLRSIRAAARFGMHPQAKALRVLETDVSEARRIVLRQIIYAESVDERHCPIPFYVYSGGSDNIVRRASAQSIFPRVGVLPGNHFSILDPDAPSSLTFDVLRKHILTSLILPAAPMGLTVPDISVTQSPGVPEGKRMPDRAASGSENASSSTDQTTTRPSHSRKLLDYPSLGDQEANSGDTIIHARISLSVSRTSPPLYCTFYCDENQFLGSAPLPNDQLLEEYRKEISLAALDFRQSKSSASLMRRELQRVIPPAAIAFLHEVTAQKTHVTTLALEIMLNDLDLECYPWELLSKSELLVDPRIAVVVWRSVAGAKSSRQPSNAALLVRSESRDGGSIFAPEELSLLADLLSEHGISTHQYPRVDFSTLIALFQMVRPAILYLTGDIHSFRFHDNSGLSKFDNSVSGREFGTYLARSSTADLVLLNIGNSASPQDDRNSLARQITRDSSATTVGMSAEIPVVIGLTFAETFFRALVSGYSVIEAYGRAVRAIRREKRFATLWSIPVMYAPSNSNIILARIYSRAVEQ